MPIALPLSADMRRLRLAWLVIGLVYAWFLAVSMHRIADAPYSGFAHVFSTGCGDFEHFYHGARAMREGASLYDSGVRGYIYPPLIAFAYMPLTFFTVQAAAWIMLFVNLGLALLCTWAISDEAIRRLATTAPPRAKVAVVMAVTAVLSAPRMRGEIQMWQTNVLLMTCLVFALRWLDSRPRWAGLLLGVAFNIKYLPLIFLPYLLFRRRFAAATGLAIGIVAFALLPALSTGLQENLREWTVAAAGLARLLGVGGDAGPAANIDPIDIGHSVSITSGMARVLSASHGSHAALVVASGAAFGLMVFIAGLYRMHGVATGNPGSRQPARGLVAIEWTFLLALALAISPQTNPRHLSMLAMPIAMLVALAAESRDRSAQWLSVSACTVLVAGHLLPLNVPPMQAAAAWWAFVGGPGWGILLSIPLAFMAGFRHLAGASGTPTGRQAKSRAIDRLLRAVRVRTPACAGRRA